MNILTIQEPLGNKLEETDYEPLVESMMEEINFCDLPKGEYFILGGEEYHFIEHGEVNDSTGRLVDLWVEPETILIESDAYDRIFEQ